MIFKKTPAAQYPVVRLMDSPPTMDIRMGKMLFKESFRSYYTTWNKGTRTVKSIGQFYDELERFTNEIRQLARINHVNIIKVYGVHVSCPSGLMMESIEGRSLYNVLHCEPRLPYNKGHVVNWALQCAQGLAYLHNLKPEPFYLSDLKSSNLLIVNEGKTLKICNFGTICGQNNSVTNEIHNAAWLAPEVFTGNNQDLKQAGKSNVYSWSIILWQSLTRCKPYVKEIGTNPYAVMLAVSKGARPPMSEMRLHPFQKVITVCWDQNPDVRLSIDEVVLVMKKYKKMFTGHVQPLMLSNKCQTCNSHFDED